MRGKRVVAAVAAVAVVGAAACGDDDGDSDDVTFTVVEERLDATVPPNPFAPDGNSYASYNSMWLAWPKNHLTDPDQFYPGLAESWELSDDGSELTVNLQPDAQWSDGEDVTAEDVEVSVNIAYTRGTGAFVLTPGAAGAARETEIIDEKTVKFSQDPENPANTFVRGVFEEMPIVPAHIYGELLPDNFDDLLETAQSDGDGAEEANEELGAIGEEVTTFDPGDDVSAGPFVLERIQASEALLVKNEHFYAADNVAPDNVVVENYSGNQNIWEYLQAGELDAAPFVDMPADVMQRIESVDGNVVTRGFSPVVAGLAFNQTYEPYDDVRVRRALAYLIDRDQAQNVASPEGGVAATTTSGVHQDSAEEWLSSEVLEGLDPYDHDPERAEQELEAAGFTQEGGTWLLPDGEPWTVTIQGVSGFSDWNKGAQNIVSQLESFGIQAETRTSPDFTVYQEEMAEGEYEVGFWLVGLGPSPYNIYQRLYGQSNGWQVLGGQLSYSEPGTDGNWKGGPETIELEDEGTVNPGELTRQLNEVDEDEQAEVMDTLAQATNQELPVIQMWDYVNTRVFNETRFEGYPDDDGEHADALRLSPGVWMAEGWITSK